jgi:ribosomal protein S18 acetylase RimI-like enzyme
MAAYFRMRRDLAAPIAPALLPDGIALVPFDKETAKEGRELMKRVYLEGLGDGGISFEGFWHWLTTDPEYDRGLMFVAAAGGPIVGWCHCWSGSFVKDLIVAPEFRGQGIGGALLTRALQEFSRRGAPSVDLKTAVENVEAQSLYRRLGFVVVERAEK